MTVAELLAQLSCLPADAAIEVSIGDHSAAPVSLAWVPPSGDQPGRAVLGAPPTPALLAFGQVLEILNTTKDWNADTLEDLSWALKDFLAPGSEGE